MLQKMYVIVVFDRYEKYNYYYILLTFKMISINDHLLLL